MSQWKIKYSVLYRGELKEEQMYVLAIDMLGAINRMLDQFATEALEYRNPVDIQSCEIV